jgi:hypothetical protein
VTPSAPRMFGAPDVTIAVAVSLLAQLLFIAAFSMPSPKLIEVDISNENSQPIAVAITPVLKLGSKTPSAVPSPWQRRRPPPAAKSEAARPSTEALKTPEAIPTTHKLDSSAVADAGESRATPATAGSVSGPAASTEGFEQGASNGTESDELKGRAADLYRAQLAAWFVSHFSIRGKVPFDRLKSLHAHATVNVTRDRKLGGFTVDRPSGDPTFDAEVNATLTRIQSSGVELPAPPPMYPEILRETLPVGFECTVEKLCE